MVLTRYVARSFERNLERLMRRARNQKTKKSVAKRFKVTATGKVMRSRPGRRHLLASKSPGRKRRLRTEVDLPRAEASRILACLPFSR